MLSPILSALAFLSAVGGLIAPLPLGLAAVMLGAVAFHAGRAERRWRRLAVAAILAGLLSIAAGFAIGAWITQP